VDGNDLAAMNDAERTKLRRHKIGFVFQRFNLLPTLDARGNIAIARISTGRLRPAPVRGGHENARAHRPLAAPAGGSFPEVNSSEWPSRERLSMNRKSSSRMNPPEIWTRKTPKLCYLCCVN